MKKPSNEVIYLGAQLCSSEMITAINLQKFSEKGIQSVI